MSIEKPEKVIVVLLDSLNRHMLGAYGGKEFDTPNIDRLAKKSVRFDNHQAGSLPCMPARHDILVGALDFLWRPWGSIELWEKPVTHYLRKKGVPTMLLTDHPHLPVLIPTLHYDPHMNGGAINCGCINCPYIRGACYCMRALCVLCAYGVRAICVL